MEMTTPKAALPDHKNILKYPVFAELDENCLEAFYCKYFLSGTDTETLIARALSALDKNDAKSRKQAMSCLLTASEQETDGTAANAIGDLYFREDQQTEAFRWYQQSARQQNPWAYYNLGYAYYYGLGVKKDISKARNCCVKAAEGGNSYAKAMLLSAFGDTGQ